MMRLYGERFSSNYRWTQLEDDKLKHAVQFHGEGEWEAISDDVGTRSHLQCHHRWYRVLKPLLKRDWDEKEDQILHNAVKIHGAQWHLVAFDLPHRTPAQCRERWNFHELSPLLNTTEFSIEEDARIMELYDHHGCQWTVITSEFNANRNETAVRTRILELLVMKIGHSDDSNCPPLLSQQSRRLSRRLSTRSLPPILSSASSVTRHMLDLDFNGRRASTCIPRIR